VSTQNKITRTTSVNQSGGTTSIHFTAASVTLNGPATVGDVWSLTLNGFQVRHPYLAGELPTDIAVDLAKQLNDHFGTGTADAAEGHNGFHATKSAITGGENVVITRPDGAVFTTSLIQIQPAGSAAADPADYVSHTVAITAGGESGTWTATLKEHGTANVLAT